MVPNSEEETLKLKMGDLQIQQTPIPKTLPELAPSPPPPPLFTLNNSELEITDRTWDFYSIPFDSSFPYKGILGNERTFSSSSTASASSFNDTPFTQNFGSAQHDSNQRYGNLNKTFIKSTKSILLNRL